MFTGLIQAIGRVAQVRAQAQGVRLVLDAGAWEHRPALGDSIAVNGVCLTLAELVASAPGAPMWGFDVVAETLTKTTLGTLALDAQVNLEHALTPSAFVGGHFVQGHVDGVGTVVNVQEGSDWRLTIRPPKGVMRFLVPQGSVCVEGVSLTVAQLGGDAFTVALIPTTLERTTLGTLKPGDGVNVEADVLVKAVVATVERMQLPEAERA